jgi:UDP-galactopyranose mutase
MKKALIIGGGFAGCAASHQFEILQNWDVTIIEKNPFLGAGVRTQWYGGHPYTFGPRHFLTPYDDVYQYLNAIVPLRKCSEHEFLTYVEQDNDFYAYPINMQDVRSMPDYPQIKNEMEEKKQSILKGQLKANNLEEYWINSVGNVLFNKFIDKYNKKMWLVEDCKKIDTFNWSPKGVALKDGPKAAWDSAISAYPYDINGYDSYFDISTKNSTVLLNTEIDSYDIQNKAIFLKGEKLKFDIVVNTISPDILFDNCYGKLPFLGREFHKIVFPTEFVFPENVYFLYYANDEKFTRLVEYKKFTHHKSKNTLIGMEIPTLDGGKHYPLPFKNEQRKAQKYLDLMPDGVFSIGRAGTYLYGVDIDDCIRQSMIMAKEIKDGIQSNPVPGEEYHFPEL